VVQPSPQPPHEPASSKGRNKLTRIWRVRKHRFLNPRRRNLLCSSMLGLTLTAEFSAAALPAAAASVAPVNISVVSAEQTAGSPKKDKHAKKPPKVDYAVSPERLAAIEQRMALTETGRELLQFAKDENIEISMSDSKTMKLAHHDGLFIKGLNRSTSSSTTILLNGDPQRPGETSRDDEIMMTIAHELRHSWHEHVVKSGALALDPRRHWLMRRLQEADAFAFEVHFGYEYEKATGKKLDIGDRFAACNKDNYFVCLAEKYRDDRDHGMALDAAYSRLLENALQHVQRAQYDRSFIAELDDGWGQVPKNPALGAQYAGRFDNPATDAEFIAAMRKVATAGLAPGTDPAALTAWKDADFLSFEKTGGRDKGDQKKLAETEKKFAQAKYAWDNFDPSRTLPKLPADLPTLLPPGLPRNPPASPPPNPPTGPKP
jgi:hypothetical protein